MQTKTKQKKVKKSRKRSGKRTITGIIEEEYNAHVMTYKAMLCGKYRRVVNKDEAVGELVKVGLKVCGVFNKKNKAT